MRNIIVVGGGLMGITTAYMLQARGHQVQVFEARENVALETSYANGGMLTASMSDPWNGPGVGRHLLASLLDPYSAMKVRLAAIPSLFFWGLQFLRNSSPARHHYACEANFLLAHYSIAKTRELRETLKLHYDAAELGTLKLFRSAESMAGPLALAESLQQHGLTFRRLDADQTVALEPQLAGIHQQITGALQFPDDESGDAHLFCRELAIAFTAAGGLIKTGTPVRRLQRQGDAVTGVVTDEGVCPADAVVVAAAHGSAALLRPFGIRLAIRPVKGYSVTIDVSGFADVPAIPVIDDAMHAAVVPLGTRLRLVGTAEFNRFNASIDQPRIDNLYNLLKTLYPHLEARIDRAAASNWTGFRPMSADGRPFIGECGVRGLYVNTGHGHLGWTKACGSAALLADLLEGQAPEINIAPFRVER